MNVFSAFFIEFLDALSGYVTAALVIITAAWGIVKWRKRDEHFPRVSFDISAEFHGVQDNKIVTEVIAELENKGVVPLKIRCFTFKVQAIRRGKSLTVGDEKVRKQLLFPEEVARGSFIPSKWEYTFVYPDVKTRYSFVTALPEDVSFIRLQAEFHYFTNDETHHAGRIL